MIDVIDNFLSITEQDYVISYTIHSPFYYGSSDNEYGIITGMTTKDIPSEEKIFKLFSEKINEKTNIVENLKIHKMYINCFSPGETPFYHIDGTEGITFLYYVNRHFCIDDGGETQFIHKNNSINILPVPNRICFFDSNILHKATSFKNKHRFTVAIKYR